MPVAVLAAVIITPGIKAPLASETVPPTVALLVWANAFAERNKHNSAATAHVECLFMYSTPYQELNSYRNPRNLYQEPWVVKETHRTGRTGQRVFTSPGIEPLS